MDDLFADADVISTYTRAEALADGELVDVTERAKELGFRYPVALTRGAWAECVAWTRGGGWQDESGRLADVLWMALLREFAVESEERWSQIISTLDAGLEACNCDDCNEHEG